MNVVVTGGAGYVGSVVVRKLLDRGFGVRVIDPLSDGEGSLVGLIDRIDVIRAEPREMRPNWLGAADAVIHLAGTCEGSMSRDDLEANWLANAVVTERVAMACRVMGVPRLLYGSTCDVYSSLPAGYEYDEEMPVRPISAFAASKFYAERRLRQWADSRFCPTILRHAIPYGVSPQPIFDLPPNRFVMDALSLGRVTLPGNAWIARPFVAVEDLAEAHVRCLEAPESEVRAQVFNVVHANIRIREVAFVVAEVVGRDVGYVRVTATEVPTGARDCRCSPAKLHHALGFTPGKTLESAVEEMAHHLTQSAAPAKCPARSSSEPDIEEVTRLQTIVPSAIRLALSSQSACRDALPGERLSGGYRCSVEGPAVGEVWS